MNMGQPSPSQGWSPPNAEYPRPPQPQGLNLPGGLPPITNQSPLPPQRSQQSQQNATHSQRNDSKNLPNVFRDSQKQREDSQSGGGIFNWLLGWIAPSQANAQDGRPGQGQQFREQSIRGLDPRDPLSHERGSMPGPNPMGRPLDSAQLQQMLNAFSINPGASNSNPQQPPILNPPGGQQIRQNQQLPQIIPSNGSNSGANRVPPNQAANRGNGPPVGQPENQIAQFPNPMDFGAAQSSQGGQGLVPPNFMQSMNQAGNGLPPNGYPPPEPPGVRNMVPIPEPRVSSGGQPGQQMASGSASGNPFANPNQQAQMPQPGGGPPRSNPNASIFQSANPPASPMPSEFNFGAIPQNAQPHPSTFPNTFGNPSRPSTQGSQPSTASAPNSINFPIPTPGIVPQAGAQQQAHPSMNRAGSRAPGSLFGGPLPPNQNGQQQNGFPNQGMNPVAMLGFGNGQFQPGFGQQQPPQGLSMPNVTSFGQAQPRQTSASHSVQPNPEVRADILQRLQNPILQAYRIPTYPAPPQLATQLMPPVGDQVYYNRITNISQRIYQWVTQHFMGDPQKELTLENNMTIRQCLETFSPIENGLTTALHAQSLSIDGLFWVPTHRRMLTEHIIALHIIIFLFYPFYVGLDPEVGKVLVDITDHLYRDRISLD